jgi:hypothetical protein
MLEIMGDDAFNACESLTCISIPASVQEIGSLCFLGCKSLNSITFESQSNLVHLWDLGVLEVANLEIPDSVETIGRITTSSRQGYMVVSFGPESKLSAIYQSGDGSGRTRAFVRYSEATLRRFRANVHSLPECVHSHWIFDGFLII